MEYVKDILANYFIKQFLQKTYSTHFIIIIMTFIPQFKNFYYKETYKSLLTGKKVQNFL